jgi:hypothetical protein
MRYTREDWQFAIVKRNELNRFLNLYFPLFWLQLDGVPCCQLVPETLCWSHCEICKRLFRREVGTSFEFWRRQMRLMKGIEPLVAGDSVKTVAAAVGSARQPQSGTRIQREISGASTQSGAMAGFQ